MADEEKLPDLYPLLKWHKAADTEKVLREILPRAREAGDANYLGELLTQIARTRGLQKDSAGAHELLMPELKEVAGIGPGTETGTTPQAPQLFTSVER